MTALWTRHAQARSRFASKQPQQTLPPRYGADWHVQRRPRLNLPELTFFLGAPFAPIPLHKNNGLTLASIKERVRTVNILKDLHPPGHQRKCSNFADKANKIRKKITSATFDVVRLLPATGDGKGYQRTRFAPHVKPPPMASSSTRSPCLMRPSC